MNAGQSAETEKDRDKYIGCGCSARQACRHIVRVFYFPAEMAMNLHTGARVHRLLPGILGVSLALSGIVHAPLRGQEMDQATLARLKAATILVKT